MSTTTRPISLHTREPAPAAIALTIRWEISPRALLASPPAAALLNGEAPRLAAAALLWHITSTTARAELALELTDKSHHAIPLTDALPITTIRLPDAGLIHIDAASEGGTDALHLTLRDRAGDSTILFARTPLLANALALPGGVYDAPTLHTRPG